MKQKYNNILKATRLLALVVLMVVGAGLKGWGQRDLPTNSNKYNEDYDFCYNRPNNNIVQNNDQPGFSEVDEILYVMPGDKVEIALQYYDVTENLNGYVRWYLEGDKEGDGTTLHLSRETSGNFGLVEYNNGYAWFRYRVGNYTNVHKDINGYYVTPPQICHITYTCPSDYDDTDPDVVVCEASSLMNFNVPITGFDNTESERIAPTLSIRKRYIIKSAVNIRSQLNTCRSNIATDESGETWLSDETENLPQYIISNPSKYFKEVYTIHTPIWNEGKGTTYRLEEQMSSYYVGNSNKPVSQVRWRTYDEKGSYLSVVNKPVPFGNPAVTKDADWANLFNHKFNLSGNLSVTHTRYITAEVCNSGGDWYPVSFQKILLEPNIIPMTQKELNDDKSYASQRRLDSFLADPNRFELLHTISFDQDAITFSDLKSGNNVAENPYSADTYYAFAFPSRSDKRASGSKTAGRGEYGLYRTLNYEGVSQSTQGYVDYFMPRYMHYAIDRTYEISKGANIGHFLFVDAADEPGVIAKIELDPKTVLCTSTSLIVTAWVCNLLHYDSNPIGADIGITFIGVEDNGTEVILDKYYSGELGRKPDNKGSFNNMTQAQWQQIYFNFTTDVQYPKYKVEISNNCRGSNGADYAIDDIRVYRSLPAIDVSRLDACESSQLYINSDYQTILNNMGWDLDDNVIEKTGVNINDFNTRKYRYGFLTNEIILQNTHVGNVYFSVLDGDKYDSLENPEIEWVVVNKKLLENENVKNLAYVIRAVVPTNIDDNSFPRFPKTKDDALALEIDANIQAMKDFNADVSKNFDEILNVPKGLTSISLEDLINKNGTDIINDENLYTIYEQKILEFYSKLEIPRIHIPWASVEDRKKGIIYLSSINVDNTDMRYIEEQDSEGNVASGHYKVYLFSAAEIINASGENGFQPHPENKCALVSKFYVLPSIVITVNTESQTGGVSCLGEVHKVDAKLVKPELDVNGYETGKLVEVDDAIYSFDWFLGSLDEYDNIKAIDGSDLKTIIYDLRYNSQIEGIQNGESPITEGVVNNSNIASDKKEILLGLLASASIRTGKNISFQLVDEIVAMPYVDNSGSEETKRLYCTKLQVVKLEANANVPELSPGFPTVDYASVQLTNVPLRIGLPNIRSKGEITDIPIQTNITLGVKETTNDNVLKNIEKNNKILLLVGEEYVPVAILTNLLAKNGSELNKMSIKFDEGSENYFLEGQVYDLLVPFGEYENESSLAPINGSCEGYAVLEIKIVPEYLTWSGEGSTWYNDENAWTISTKKELYYKSDVTNVDEDVYSFSPLYFTKITVPDGMELPLYNEATQNSIQTNKPLDFLGMGINLGTTSNIEYDMAVYSADGGKNVSVEPYYGNMVEQIYFKPKATLLNQHYLNYQKAWVEFEMTKKQPYWMSSPLKDVYAGDMYAPAATGRQETPAFDEITYNKISGTNSRWRLPFYQKAWNKAVWYKPSNDAGAADVEVPLVQSNWSIEYNDVWVPYSVGKGFYSRVESDKDNIKNVLVRLPKDDSEYGYETTKALSTKPESRPNSGKFHTDETTNGNIELNLSSSVDGDGEHFLIGNPYMAYLNMFESSDKSKKGFLTVNSVSLAQKYWVLNDGTASVGTPDVAWENGKTSGYIAPMQAFFVERAGYSTAETQADEGAANTDLTVTFSIDMTVANPTSKDGETTTRAFEATNPQLTILAKGAEGKSVSFVVQSDFAENVYMSDEDAVALLDSELKIPMVYTVAGNCAAAVNKVKDMQNIPLGVYAEEDEEVEVTIEGMSQFVDSLYLHDALTGKSVLLDGDTYTLRVNGENHGRYTITTKGGITVESNICVYSPSSNNLMIAASPSETLEQVRVFDMSGRMVENRVDLGSSNCRLRIASGIYIVYAKTEAGETKVKVRVK